MKSSTYNVNTLQQSKVYSILVHSGTDHKRLTVTRSLPDRDMVDYYIFLMPCPLFHYQFPASEQVLTLLISFLPCYLSVKNCHATAIILKCSIFAAVVFQEYYHLRCLFPYATLTKKYSFMSEQELTGQKKECACGDYT